MPKNRKYFLQQFEYFEQDFYVSSNNFSAYKLIESWPNWPGKWLNVYGDIGAGKSHLAKILEKKILILDGPMGTMIQKENLSEEDADSIESFILVDMVGDSDLNLRKTIPGNMDLWNRTENVIRHIDDVCELNDSSYFDF